MHKTLTLVRQSPRLARWLWHTTLDLVFPAQCVGCGRVGSLLCGPCRTCLQQAAPIRLGAPYLDGIYAAGEFVGARRRAIHAFKYEGQCMLTNTLAALLPVPAGISASVLVVPVPLHPNRQRWRGYNQSALLAAGLAARLGIEPAADDALARIRDTRPQVGLNAAERRRNMEGAFRAAPERVAGREVILVDDVCTTGATLSAGAQALRAAGAVAVWAVTLACAPSQSTVVAA